MATIQYSTGNSSQWNEIKMFKKKRNPDFEKKSIHKQHNIANRRSYEIHIKTIGMNKWVKFIR